MFVVVHVYFIVLLQLQLVSSREYVDAPGQLFCIFNVFHTTKGSQYCSKLRLRGGSLMPIIIKLLTLHNRDDAPCPCIYFFFDKSGIQAHCVGAHLRKSLIPFTALSSQRLNACTVVSLVTHRVMCRWPLICARNNEIVAGLKLQTSIYSRLTLQATANRGRTRMRKFLFISETF